MMIMAVKEDSGKVAGPQECAGCGKKIHDKFLLKVILMWINMMLILLTFLSTTEKRSTTNSSFRRKHFVSSVARSRMP